MVKTTNKGVFLSNGKLVIKENTSVQEINEGRKNTISYDILQNHTK